MIYVNIEVESDNVYRLRDGEPIKERYKGDTSVNKSFDEVVMCVQSFLKGLKSSDSFKASGGFETKNFEGNEFTIVAKINSDACWSSVVHVLTDYTGYKRVCDLLEELDPPKQELE